MAETWENRYQFLVSSADPDDDPVWVDLTSRVREDEEPMMSFTGRQNDLDQADPGQLTLQLDNDNDDFTFGNTNSPYASWWAPGRLCQLRETIAGQVVNLWTGYLQTPTEAILTATEDGEGDRKRVNVSAMDRLGRLDTSEPFPSALGAYVLYHSDLIGYWPLTDESERFGGIGPETDPLFVGFGSGKPAGTVITPRGGRAPVGGEANGARCLSSGTNAIQISIPLGFTPAIGASQSFTAVAWLAVTATAAPIQWVVFFTIMGSSSILGLTLSRDVTTGVWTLTADTAMTGSVAGSAPGDGALFPVGIRLDMAAASMELWIGGQRFTTTLTGTPPTNAELIQANWGSLPLDYDFSHFQLYVGSSYSYSDFQQQIAMGYHPLERQTTGARILTLARYAGIPESQLSRIDTGTAIMQAALLAGKSPLTAMREAEAVERGLLYVDGSGNLVFKDRRTLYNV